MEKFSDNLRRLMSERQMSAAELARATGLSEAAISGYLNGKKEPRGAQSVSLARALGVSLDELWQTGFRVQTEGDAVTVTVSDKEKEMIYRLRLLNADGLRKMDVYVDDLLNSGHGSPWISQEDLEMRQMLKEGFKLAARSGGVKSLNSRQKRDRERLVDGLKNRGKKLSEERR